MGPHRGPTSRYRGYAAGSPADNAVQTPARATCPRIPAPERRRSEVRPLWGRSKVGSLSAGALRLPAVINSATPMGSAAVRKHLSPRPHGRKPPHNARRHARGGVPALYVDAAQRRWKIAVPTIALSFVNDKCASRKTLSSSNAANSLLKSSISCRLIPFFS